MVVDRRYPADAFFRVSSLPGDGSDPPVLTQHNNDARTGAYATETVLTPTNVDQANFGKIFSCTVDGRIHAQPL
jgi:hypothetical protein